MISALLNFGLLAAVLNAVAGYPYQPRFANMKANAMCKSYPQPLSYHIHVTYMLTNDDQIATVSALRDQAASHFAPFLGDSPKCQGTEVEPSGRYGELPNIY